MALSPQKFREIVFQILYSYDLGQASDEAMLELMMAELEVSKKHVKLAQEKARQIMQKLPEIDPLIASASTSYDFDRIQTVTKNILRLGVFELFFEKEVPYKVSIAEAMRLSRKFASPESASFVNALLDYLYQASLGEQTNQESVKDSSHHLIQSEEQARQVALEAQKETKTKEDVDSL